MGNERNRLPSSAEAGLHEKLLKRCLNQTTPGRLPAYVQQLAQSMPAYIRTTERKAQVREIGYQLVRGSRSRALASTSSRKDEDRLEAEIHRAWMRPTKSMAFLRDANHGEPIVSFIPSSQVPLFNKGGEAGKGDWGYVDLLGCGRDGAPVVMELKILRFSPRAHPETPLRAAVEALAYGVSLRKSWSRVVGEWVKIDGVSCPLDRPAEFTLVVLGTECYWKAVELCPWFGDLQQTMPKLLAAMKAEGFVCRFATINADCDTSNRRIWKVCGPSREVPYFVS